jgi:cation transport regulator ChaB
MPARENLPSTIKRSPKHAQDTYAETLDSAVEQYGDGERAHRTALASLKHSFEKVGDHWEPKGERGPSDEQAAVGGADTDLPTAGGVDANAGKEHLLQVAKRLGVTGHSRMTKAELVNAIQKANDTASRKALNRERQ